MNKQKKHRNVAEKLHFRQLASSLSKHYSWNELSKLESSQQIASLNLSAFKLGRSTISFELWEIANKRRDKLIRIENQRKLSPSEAIELQGLQALTTAIIKWLIHCMICKKKKSGRKTPSGKGI